MGDLWKAIVEDDFDNLGPVQFPAVAQLSIGILKHAVAERGQQTIAFFQLIGRRLKLLVLAHVEENVVEPLRNILQTDVQKQRTNLRLNLQNLLLGS